MTSNIFKTMPSTTPLTVVAIPSILYNTSPYTVQNNIKWANHCSTVNWFTFETVLYNNEQMTNQIRVTMLNGPPPGHDLKVHWVYNSFLQYFLLKYKL